MGGLLSSTIQIPSSQVITINTANPVLVTAAGVGNVIVVYGVNLVYAFGTVAYLTTGTDVLTPTYDNVVNTPVTATTTGLITGTTNGLAYRPGISIGPLGFLTGLDNINIKLRAASLYNAGPVLSATINAAGTGYAVNDTGTINGGTADATYQITSIGAAGAVTGFAITSGGTKYVTGNGIATTDGGAQPGVGTGFKVNITAVEAGDGSLKVVTYYTIVPVP